MLKPSLDELYSQPKPSLDSLYNASPRANTSEPQQSLAQTIWRGAMGVGNFVLGGASDLGTHLGQAAAIGTGKAVTALTGNDALEQRVAQNYAKPQTNLFGAPIKPIQPGVEGNRQLAGDVLKTGAELATFTSAPAKLAGTVATGAGIGAASAAGDALQKNASGSEVLKQGAVGAAVGGAAAGAVYGLGKLVGKIGDKLQTSIIKPTKPDIEDGFKLDTVKKYNLGGSLNATLTKTQAKLNELSTQLSEKLGNSPNRINLNDVYEQTFKELTDSSKLKGFGANAKIASTLENLKNEVSLVGSDLSIPEAQIVKQASGSFGAWQFGKVDPDSKASEIVFNTFYSKLKTAIEQNSPEGVRAINQQLSELIPVQNAVLRRLPVAQRSGLISLNEMIGLVGSAANPIALGPTLLAVLSRSGTAAQALSKAGPAISSAAIPAAYTSGQLPGLVSETAQSQSDTMQSYEQPTTTPTDTLGGTYSPEQLQALRDGLQTGNQIMEAYGPGAIGAVEKRFAGAVLSRIHPEDVQVMTKFIDAVRLKQGLPLSVDKAAQALAEHWGINVQGSAAKIADKFDEILTGKIKVKSTNLGKFTPNQ